MVQRGSCSSTTPKNTRSAGSSRRRLAGPRPRTPPRHEGPCRAARAAPRPPARGGRRSRGGAIQLLRDGGHLHRGARPRNRRRGDAGRSPRRRARPCRMRMKFRSLRLSLSRPSSSNACSRTRLAGTARSPDVSAATARPTQLNASSRVRRSPLEPMPARVVRLPTSARRRRTPRPAVRELVRRAAALPSAASPTSQRRRAQHAGRRCADHDPRGPARGRARDVLGVHAPRVALLGRAHARRCRPRPAPPALPRTSAARTRRAGVPRQPDLELSVLQLVDA